MTSEDLAEIKKLQLLLKQKLDEDQTMLRDLAKRLWAQQEVEKAKLSRELHDGVGQLLTGLTRRLQSIAGESPELKELFGIAEMALNDIRQLSRLMSPTILEDLGLKPALQWLCRNLLHADGIDYLCQIEINDELTQDINILLFRIAQEALVNVAKHSRATQVSLQLTTHKNLARLDIIDNGIGFNKHDLKQGVGLYSINDRSKAFDAALEIDSAPAQGTRITVKVPL